MLTPLDITTRIYSILNVPAIKTLIGGDIYKDSMPEKQEGVDTVENIAIIPLTSLSSDVGDNIININVIVPDLSNGTANTAKLNLITNAVISELYNYESTSDYFDIQKDMIQTRLIRDSNNKSFINARVQVLTA
jgi:hypothetical protein